jgi:hypothetical protein
MKQKEHIFNILNQGDSRYDESKDEQIWDKKLREFEKINIEEIKKIGSLLDDIMKK